MIHLKVLLTMLLILMAEAGLLFLIVNAPFLVFIGMLTLLASLVFVALYVAILDMLRSN